MKQINTLLIATLVIVSIATGQNIKDKTLVAWASPANLTQSGGSVLSIDDCKTHFDGIVFGELTPGKWMPGSDFYKRTEKDQQTWPVESVTPGTYVQIAIVYRNKEITVYRNSVRIAQYQIATQQKFGKESAVLMGLRHLDAADKPYFAGSVEDARIYDIALAPDQIRSLKPDKLSEPKPIAWWSFEEGTKDCMGLFPEGVLVGSARIENSKLILDGKGSCFITPAAAATALPPVPYKSPIHYRPEIGALADTIPLFFNNQYHVFYLHRGEPGTPWEHIVSDDLIHWKELPVALRQDSNKPQSFDGCNMFTGCVIEHEGLYHIFYTGHNPHNPDGLEFVCHATSPDGVTWTKHPEHAFGPDGIHYQSKKDFRDPYVFWNEEDHCFWMILCTREAKTGKPVQGVARSKDLVSWEQVAPLVFEPPLSEGTPECPDMFKCGDTWYLLNSPCAGTTDVRWSKSIRGPWCLPEPYAIDTPILYAAKRMFDGKRHVLTGWIRDLGDHRDSGGWMWGGTQSLPREAYAGPDGQLFFKPVDEVVDVFSHIYLEKKLKLSPDTTIAEEVPDNYMTECYVQMDSQAEFTMGFRVQDDKTRAYNLTISPSKNQGEISGPGFSSKRSCFIDTSKPVKIQAFLQGTILECFINDRYAFSWRAYDLSHGKFSVSIKGGNAEVESLQIRLPPNS